MITVSKRPPSEGFLQLTPEHRDVQPVEVAAEASIHGISTSASAPASLLGGSTIAKASSFITSTRASTGEMVSLLD